MRRAHGEDRQIRHKICLVSAAGGHLTQILRVRPFIREADAYLVTVGIPSVRGQDFGCPVYFVERILRNPICFLVNFLQSLWIFIREKPDIVISTGSGEAVPTFILASCLGRKTIYLESFARVRKLSATGRIVWRFADTLLVQWRTLLDTCPRADFVGPVFAQGPTEAPSSPLKILVTVGTQAKGFDNLIRTVDDFFGSQPEQVEILAQIGTSKYEPRHLRWFRFLPQDQFAKLLQWADVVVTHSGAGSIGQALELGKRIIVAPRVRSRGESLWRGDAELPEALSNLGVVQMASVEQVPALISRTANWVPNKLKEGRLREEIVRTLAK